MTSGRCEDPCARMANPTAKVKGGGSWKSCPKSQRKFMGAKHHPPRSRGDGQASGGNPAPSFYSHKMGTATANGVVSAPLAQCPVPRTRAITATSSSLLRSQVIWKKTHTYKARNPPWHNLMDRRPWRGWEPGGGEVGRKERGGLCDQNVSSSSH